MPKKDFMGLKALFFNGTLNVSPKKSHTDLLINISKNIMEKNGVKTEVIRTVDHDIPPGIYPDMSEQGYKSDEWPKLYKKVLEYDILVIAGPIWLGDNSSMTKKLIERLYSNSGDLNEHGQSVFYGRAGGCIISGNEDGLKHCAQYVLYSLQHIGYSIPPQADAGWIGEVGPGPSYGDDDKKGGKIGFDNDFTKRNLTFMSYNLMHLAKILKENNGFPSGGNDRKQWDDGNHFGYENPEYK